MGGALLNDFCFSPFRSPNAPLIAPGQLQGGFFGVRGHRDPEETVFQAWAALLKSLRLAGPGRAADHVFQAVAGLSGFTSSLTVFT